MSNFTPVNYTIELIENFALNGDYEALSLIDFRDFTDNSIRCCIDSLNKRIKYNSESMHYKLHNDIIKCIELLESKINDHRVWEITDYTIDCRCYEYQNTCIHKLKHKNTQEIHMVCADDIKQLLNHEIIQIKHFIDKE